MNLDSVPYDRKYGHIDFYSDDLPIGVSVAVGEDQCLDGNWSEYVPTYFDRHFGNAIDPSNIDLPHTFSGCSFPSNLKICLTMVGESQSKLHLRVLGAIEGAPDFKASAQLTKVVLPDRSVHQSTEISWSDYKTKVNSLSSGAYMFRGQSQSWPLQSAFHRSNRSCLQRFNDRDVQQLHRATSAFTSHVFRMDQPEERGALVAMAQHHGYPTPLIDWSLSPYVGAWFAYENAREKHEESEGPVRVLMLNREVLQTFPQSNFLTLTDPHISILETLAIENPRLAPQQGILTITNVHDVERHIRGMEDKRGINLLTAYDLPYFERKKALNEMRLMGITKRTLFPGLDGICDELAQLNFK